MTGRVITQTTAAARVRGRADLVTVDVWGTFSRPTAWAAAKDKATAALEPGESRGRLVTLRQAQRPRGHYLAQWTVTWRVVR